MICPRPISVGQPVKVPCGDCLPCRINRQRAWAARLELERSWQVARGCGSSFVTLTYEQDAMPVGLSQFDAVPQGVLDRSHPRNWLKKLRRELPEYRVRYMLVGEYGDRSWRPHYHLALFGPPTLLLDQVVPETWTRGWSSVRELTVRRSMYVAHYTTKKLRNEKTELDGRPPEFMTSSRRPGLGVPQLAYLLSLYRKPEGKAALEAQCGDIATSFETGGTPMAVRSNNAKQVTGNVRDSGEPDRAAPGQSSGGSADPRASGARPGGSRIPGVAGRKPGTPAGDACVKPRILLIRERAAGDAEHPDPTPVHIPGELHEPPPLRDLVAQMVAAEVARRTGQEDHLDGDPVEQDFWDFDIQDDAEELLSDYQVLEMIEDFEAEHGYLQEVQEVPPASLEDPASTPPTYEGGTVAADLIATVRTDRDPDNEKKNSGGKEE